MLPTLFFKSPVFGFSSELEYKEEWAAAEEFFKENPTEIKYQKKLALDYTSEDNSRKKITHSFVKFEDRQYILSNKKLGLLFNNPKRTRVKLALDKKAQIYAMKIERFDEKGGPTPSEDEISKDTGFLPHSGIYHKKTSKYYRPFVFLGKSLFEILAQYNLSDHARFELAIKSCIELYHLHTGQSAKSKTAYFHQDFKPGNITFDAAGNLHIIDYGAAEPLYEPHHFSSIGTKLYLPYVNSFEKYSQDMSLHRREIKRCKVMFGPMGIDVFALKRSLWVDPDLYNNPSFDDKIAIFTKEMLERFPRSLQTILNTTTYYNSFYRNDDTALYLATLLISYSKNPNLDIEEFELTVKFDEDKQVEILNEYKAAESISDKINQFEKEIASDKTQVSYVELMIEEAVLQERADVIEALGEAGLSFNKLKNREPLGVVAVINKNYALLEALGKYGYDFNLKDEDNKASALFYAAEDNDVTAIKILIKYKADPNLGNKNGATPIFIAAQYGNIEAIRELMQSKADPHLATANGRTPLFIALWNAHENTAEFLSAQGDINVLIREQDLARIAEANRLDLILILHKLKFDFNRKRELDWTIAHMVASKSDHAEMVKTLAKINVDLEARDIEGTTPIYIAARRGHLTIFSAFVNQGVELLSHRNNGTTLSSAATGSGKAEIIKELIKLKVPINDPLDDRNYTNLIFAAEYGKLEVVKALLEDKSLDPLPLIVGKQEILRTLVVTKKQPSHPIRQLFQKKLEQGFSAEGFEIGAHEVAEAKGFFEIARLIKDHYFRDCPINESEQHQSMRP